MKSLTLADLLPREEFIARRDVLRAEISLVKQARRLALGDHMSLHFENRDTLRWQVQEMCRVEKISDPQAIQAELDAYNPLIPGESELSASLFIEYEDKAERARMLVALTGLSRHVWVEIDGEDRVAGVFDDGREEEQTGKVSSVQYVRFPLSPSQRAALLDLSRKARLVVDHPAYAVSVPLPGLTRGALFEDLTAA